MIRPPSDAVLARPVTILGATGSVGLATLDLIAEARARWGEDAIPIEALTARTSVDELAALAKKFRPKLAVVSDPSYRRALESALAGTGVEVAAGDPAVIEAAQRPAPWVMSAIVGAAGLEPTLAAARRGAAIAIANKEALVCAGDLVTAEVARGGGALLPVDSEHNAIFQALRDEDLDRVEKITLTASGGPFRTWTLAEMARATPEQAVAHPNWSMGAKISVDSATLMNKGLELIEARCLFGVETARLDAVVHPQSVVHGLVAFCDGSVLAQLGAADMRIPIASALAWPERTPTDAPRLDLAALRELTFEPPDPVRFPCLELARHAMESGHQATAVLNAANEEAVAAFLDRKIAFLDIPRIVEEALTAHAGVSTSDDIGGLAERLDLDRAARKIARDAVGLAAV